jgi:hypothetical protein
MTLQGLAEAAAILAKYAEPNEPICAEHDQIWLGNPEWPLTDVERDRLRELGLRADDDGGFHAFV